MLISTLVLAMAGAPVEGDLLISNVTVIDPATETVTSGRDILVDDGRIVAISAHGTTDYSAYQTIDAAGHYVIPGLNDMHAHSSFAPIHVSSLKLFHANGVTGVREMGSDCYGGGISMCLDAMKVSRAKIEAGEMIGPRLMELSSAKMGQRMGKAESEEQLFYRPANAEEAEASVAWMQHRGAEILKVSSEWMPNTFEPFVAAANEAGIRVGGHLPFFTSVGEAARLGVDTIEHARDLPMDCAAIGPELRDHMRRKLSGEDLPWPDRNSIPSRSVDEFDAELCDEQVKMVADAGAYYVPTHLTREMDYRAVEDEYRDDPRLVYIPKMQQDNWNRDLDRTASAPPEFIEQLERFYFQGLKTTKIAHDAGVKVMVGTDANDTMVFPGFSVHDEIANLVEAGLTPMQALAAATTVPADYFGREDMGGISEGMVADLVLLSANPIDDIANTTAIEAVIQDGRVSDRAALDQLLEEVKAFTALSQAGQNQDD